MSSTHPIVPLSHSCFQTLAKRLRGLAGLFVLCALGGTSLHGAPQHRKQFQDSVRELSIQNVEKVESMQAAQLKEEVEFHVALKMRDYPKLLDRIAAGERLTIKELREKYFPTKENYDAVVKWAESQNLKVSQHDQQNHLGVFIGGSVGQLQQALQVQFAKVTTKEGVYTSAITAPSLPAELGASILGINGLQPQIHYHKTIAATPYTSNAAPYLVKEILGAYNANNAGYDGTGEKIAILIDTFPANTDLTAFWSANGIPQTLTNIEKVAVVPGVMPAPTGEETLDVEWTSGIASGSKIRIYATTSLSLVNIDKGLQKIINDLPSQPQMHQLSISLGLGETFESNSQLQTDSQYYATIAALGVSVFVSSGDSGSNEGGKLQVSYSASDPSVTAVGGTSLNLFPASGAVSSETAWTGSGGGSSTYFARPSWQTGASVPAGTKRLVPDVAAAADPNTGAYVYLGGSPKQIGGTSWSAPMWAGFCAMINQSRIANGQPPMGLMNPLIYPLLGSSEFRDVTSGNNGAYSAAAGYDKVTGLGAPDVGMLISVLGGVGNGQPSIISFNPNIGPVGTVVTINGTNLNRVDSIVFDDHNGNVINAPVFTVVSGVRVQVTVPPAVTVGPNMISITTPQGSVDSLTDFTVTPPVTNDMFNSALVITGSGGTIFGSNVGATKQPNEPNHAGNDGGASVWYNWTAPSGGVFTFDTAVSNFDTLLAVYQGNSLPVLSQTAANDDAGTSTTSSVTFTATPGTTYHIAVDGFNGAVGSVHLNWAKSTAAPTITDFFPASGTVGTVVQINGANFTGTTNVDFGGVAALFSVNSDTQISATVPFGAITGPIHVLAAQSPTKATSAANFVVLAPVSNDNFANAQPIGGGAGTIAGSNIGAGKETGEPNHALNAGGKSIWYAWTAPSDGIYTFDTIGSSFDTLMGIYTGSAVNLLSEIASNDDMGNATVSRVSFSATGGVVYYVAVDGFNGAGGSVALNWAKNTLSPSVTGFTPASGSPGTIVTINGAGFLSTTQVLINGTDCGFTVFSDNQIFATIPANAVTGIFSVVTQLGTADSATSFIVTNKPGNDDFVNRSGIVGSTVNVAGSNVGATREAGEPNHAGNIGGHSVWWTWTAPSTGLFAITTQGSNFDTVLAVYTGNSVGALGMVASNDDERVGVATSRVRFNATQNVTYQIAVDGFDGVSGKIALSVLQQGAVTSLFYTGFETSEGYDSGLPLAGLPPLGAGGQNGWLRQGSGGNGILVDEFGTGGQQAYIGSTPPRSPDSGLVVWRPLGFTPSLSQPIIKFSVEMSVVDSNNGVYDSFQWRVFNQNAHELFALSFDNQDLGIYYKLDKSQTLIYTGKNFDNNAIYKLEITMDFVHNLWSATLDGNPIVIDLPITSIKAPLNLGDIDAAWAIHDPFTFGAGDNYLVFDNFTAVVLADPRPVITFQPQSQTVNVNDTASFGVVATGELPLAFQWRFNGAPIPGAITANLTLNNVQPSDAGTYTVRVSNKWGFVTSNPVTLAVNIIPGPPAIVTQPKSLNVVPGSTAAFSVVATGSVPMQFQWTFNNNTIVGATNSTLVINNAQAPNAGSYAVTVTNNLGTQPSTSATLGIGLPFSALGGSYNGIITPIADPSLSGYISVIETLTGSFSAKIYFAGKNFSVKSHFDNTGMWSGFLGFDPTGRPVNITLQLGLLAGVDKVTGTISAGVIASAINADRALFGTTNPSLQAGTYTMLLPADPAHPEATYPQGTGWGTVTVDVAGNLRLSGKLGNGTAISQGTTLSKTGAWPVFLIPFKVPGEVFGNITFANVANVSDFAGTLTMVKTASPFESFYPAGFNGQIAAQGSRYVPPAPGQRVLNFGTQNQAKILLTNGGLVSQLTELVSVDATNRVTTITSSNQFRMTIQVSNGTYTASFLQGTATRQVTGVVFQKANTGGGVFNGATQTGSSQVLPQP